MLETENCSEEVIGEEESGCGGKYELRLASSSGQGLPTCNKEDI